MGSVSQTPSGKWRVLIRIKGHSPVCKTFTTERKAREFERDAERKLRSGESLGISLTISEAVARFREFRDKGTRPIETGRTEDYYLRHISAEIGHIKVASLTTNHLIAWCRERADGGTGPATMGSEISKLGTVLRFISASTNNPMMDVVKASYPLLDYNGLVGASKHRSRRPSPEEVKKLRGSLPPILSLAMDFAIATGLRRGEITRILWDDLDVQRKCVLVRDRKHPTKKLGNHILVPLTAHSGIDAWALLESVPRTDKRIFPLVNEWVSDTFKTVCDSIGIVDLHFHDMRHEAASRFFEAGLQIHQVAVLTGHKNWRNLQRYTQIRPETLHVLGTDLGTRQDRDSPRSEPQGLNTSAG